MYIKEKKIDYLVLVVIIWFSLLYLRSYLEPIFLGWQKYTFLCSDFWQYISHGEPYSKDGAELIKIMAVGEEPGLFLISSTLERIMGFSETWIALIISAININLLIGLAFYCWIKRITNSRKFWLLWVLILISIFTYSRASNLLVLRQLLSIAFLLIFALNWFSKNNSNLNSKKIIISILVWGTILAHRSWLVVLILYSLTSIFYCFAKGKYQDIKNIILITCLSIIFSGPFFAIQILDLIRSFLWEIGVGSVTNIFDSQLGYVNNLTSNNSGFSYLIGGETKDMAIYHYFVHQGIYLIAWTAFLRTALLLFKKHKDIINFWWILLILLLYVNTRMAFSVRMLVAFEIFYLFFLIVLLNEKKKNRFTIIFFLSVFLVGLIDLGKPVIVKERSILWGPDVNFVKNNIHKNKSYIIGDFCVSDFASQLGYTNANNFESALLWKGWTLKEGESEWILNYYAHLKLSQTLTESISEKPYIYKSFENFDLYIMFLLWTPDTKISPLLNSPYLDVIYKGVPGNRLKYVFKVRKENIIYFDTTNYIYKN